MSTLELIEAAEKGDRFITEGAHSISGVDKEDKSSLLRSATSSGHLEVVRSLIRGKDTQMSRVNSAVTLPTLSEDRKSALLSGIVPCFDIALNAAYGDGVRQLSSRVDSVTRDELKPEELGALLCAGEELCRLALHILIALARSASRGDINAMQSLREVLKAEILPAVFFTCFENAKEVEQEAEHYGTPRLTVVALCAEFLALVSGKGIDPACVPSISPPQMQCLAGAIVAVMRDACEEHSRGTTLAETEISLSISLLESFFSFEAMFFYLATESYVNEFCEPRFLRAALMFMTRFNRTNKAQLISILIKKATNYGKFCNALGHRSVEGFKVIIDALSSTSHDEVTICHLLIAVSNTISCTGNDADQFALMLVNDLNALTFLQPVLVHQAPALSILAAETISNLACRKIVADAVEKSGALRLIEEVIRGMPPGCVQLPVKYSIQDVPSILLALSVDALPAIQLSELHSVAGACHSKENRDVMKSSAFVQAFRVCAASSDPFIYIAAAYILRALDLPVPSYRNGVQSNDDLCGVAPPKWSIDMVCLWVGNQSFKAFRTAFRDGLVNGRVLLSMKDDDLIALGIEHQIHRRAILFAIEDLQNSPTSIKPIEKAQSTYDVFISYRRAGGADFAHLLKLYLESNKLTVFLDVENLGSGKFDDKLESSLIHSKNMLLVWSKGCMDRFLDDNDMLNQDFVRREYALALKCKTNLVPVYKEDFEFPSDTRLPTDVRNIISFNAIKWVSEYKEASVDKILRALAR